MTRQRTKNAAKGFLGIDAGGTRTVAVWEDDESGRRVRRESGPANLKLITDAELTRHFKSLSKLFPKPEALGIGMAGARLAADRNRIIQAAARAWPGIPCHATHDLETALTAAQSSPSPLPQILLLSGTGSCCYGQSPDGRTAKIGGWGHILGDKGSAYEIGLRGLKAVVYYFDRDGIWPALGERLLATLQLNEPDALIPWAQEASKTEIAALAVQVFEAWSHRDRIANDILTGAWRGLAKDALHCADRLAGANEPVQFVFSGSVLLKQKRFARSIATELKRRRPSSIVTLLKRESADGAVMLARRLVSKSGSIATFQADPHESAETVTTAELAKALTEQRHPDSMHLDRMPVGEAIELMLAEDARIPVALRAEQAALEKAVHLIVRSFRSGGRLFYVGAGTSGRLGVLDASECPPTFQSPPEQVQGIIAGGRTALWKAVEGAEDDPDSGARAVVFRGVRQSDVVVGIAASGRTPFVWGALGEARRRGAKTILLTFNPSLVIPRGMRPHLLIAPHVGPEVLTGSTRLKAGTATKLVLNIFTTLAMVRTGKVLGNLMIDVKATNVKLRDRATRMVRELAGVDYDRAREALEKTQWNIKKACQRLGS